jgi:hypothetical protein
MPKKKRSFHRLHEGALQRLAAQGDPTARAVLLHRRIVHRMVMDPREEAMEHRCLLSENLWLDFHRDRETGGYVEMYLKIEEASLEKIKRNWPEIVAWQELLLMWQGPSLQGGANDLIHHLDLLNAKGRGVSYAVLAKKLNDIVAKDLTAYWEDRSAYRRAQNADMFHTQMDIMRWKQQTSHYGLGLGRAQSLLQDMGLKETTIRQWCANALRNLRQEQPPFPLDEGPITRDHLIMRLRTWRQMPHPDVGRQIAFARQLRRAWRQLQDWATWQLANTRKGS